MGSRDEETPRIHGYTLEVRKVQETVDGPSREVLAIVLKGDYFHVGATPIVVTVGDVPALPAESDGTTLVAILYTQPPEGVPIVVRQGDQVMVAPEPFTIKRLRRRPPRRAT